MPLRCLVEQLDDDTFAYLKQARTSAGRGMPGVYVSRSNSWPTWAFLVGVIGGPVAFVLSLRADKSAWANAAIQTAVVLVFGWLTVYAVRRWIGTSRTYLGTFLFFDPEKAYDVAGETVTVFDVGEYDEVVAMRSANGVRVAFVADGDIFAQVPVPHERAAVRVQEFYTSLVRLEHTDKGPWQTATVAERGAAAVFAADEEQMPRDLGDIELDVTELPQPEKARRGGFGVVWLGLILIAGGGLFAFFYGANKVLNDGIAFDRAKQGGAVALRGYLLDDRYSAHRDEAKQLISKAYDPAVAKLKAAQPGVQPKAREGMIALLDMLRTAPAGVLSLSVTGEPANDPGESDTIRREVADGLARQIGPTLVAFAAPPSGQPAHLEITYRKPAAEAVGTKWGYTVTFRPSLTDKPHSVVTFEKTAAVALNQPGVLKPATTHLCEELVGGWTPAPPPPPPDFGWDN